MQFTNENTQQKGLVYCVRHKHHLKMTRTTQELKETVHSQKIFFKYVTLRTVNKNFTIIITKYT